MRLRWDWDEIEMRLRSATIRWDNAVCSSRLAGLAVQWHICDISVFSYPCLMVFYPCLVVSYPCPGSTVTAAHCYPGWWCVGLQVLHTVAVSGGVLAYRFYTPWLSRQRRYKWQGRKKIYLLDLLTAVILRYPGWKYVGLLFMHGGCLNIQEGRKEMFYLMTHSTHFILWLYGVGHMVKNHSDSERRNLLQEHVLLFSITSKGSFICTIP